MTSFEVLIFSSRSGNESIKYVDFDRLSPSMMPPLGAFLLGSLLRNHYVYAAIRLVAYAGIRCSNRRRGSNPALGAP